MSDDARDLREQIKDAIRGDVDAERLPGLEKVTDRVLDVVEPMLAHVYVIAFDQDTFGIFRTREAAEADKAKQIAAGGPAWEDCEVEQRWVR